MVKAPSSHGLDRKFKPWRKGKSAHAKKQGSLKHQLRGQQRLLARLQKQNQDTTEIEQSIDRLKQEIAQKEHQEHAKQHAKKSHGTRFLERQRLTRLERNARKAKQQDAQELLRIAMDQIYVAHYPLDNKSYRPLFKNGKRWLHHSVSRATLRNTILQGLANQTISRVKWIPQDQYNRVPKTWTVEQEVQLYNYPTLTNGTKQKKKAKVPTDSRFASAQSANHEALLQAAQEEESKLDQMESKGEHDSDSSDSSEEEVAPVAAANKKSKADDSSSESSSDSSSSSDEEEDDPKPRAVAKKRTSKESSSSSSDSSSSSSSDSDSSDEEEPTTNKKQSPAHHKRKQEEPTPSPAKEEEDDSEDEFLIAAKDDKDEDVNVFDKVQQQQELPAENLAKGDKSQGWATQQQRPGKYKKKRTRR